MRLPPSTTAAAWPQRAQGAEPEPLLLLLLLLLLAAEASPEGAKCRRTQCAPSRALLLPLLQPAAPAGSCSSRLLRADSELPPAQAWPELLELLLEEEEEEEELELLCSAAAPCPASAAAAAAASAAAPLRLPPVRVEG